MIESLIGLSITSFIIVSLLGLLSVGLGTTHTALNTSAQTQIIQDLVNNISQATNLSTYVSGKYNYDNAGNLTNTASIYQVSVTKGSVTAPAGVLSSTAASTFVIRVTTPPGAVTNTYSVLIPTPPAGPGS